MNLIYQNQVRSETDQAVIANLLRKGWTEQPPAPAVQANEQAVWANGAWVIESVQPSIPQSVPTWALREAVEEAGKTAEIEGVLNALPTANAVRVKARNRWEYKETIRRDTPLFNAVKQAVGWTDSFIDQLFVRANQITTE